MPNPYAARYDAGLKITGGRSPIEAGVVGQLADHECRHGRLAGDRTPACGCWPEEGAAVIELANGATARRKTTLRQAA